MSKTVIQSLKDYIQFLEKMSDKEFIEFRVEEAKKYFPDFMEEQADNDNTSEMLELREDNTRLRSLLGDCLDKMYKHSPSCTFSTIPECICEIGKLRTKIENKLKGGK